jgi:hypothetical protein
MGWNTDSIGDGEEGKQKESNIDIDINQNNPCPRLPIHQRKRRSVDGFDLVLFSGRGFCWISFQLCNTFWMLWWRVMRTVGGLGST